MFDRGILVIGKLDEILDDKGTMVYALNYFLLDTTTYEVEIYLTSVARPIVYDPIAWTVPILGVFEPTRMVALKGGWQLRKVLLAVNEVEVDTSEQRPYMLNGYSRLKGCAKQIPLNEEERFLCDIHGIKYV